MIDRLEIWRRRSWIWWAPLAFVALNVASIVFFQTTFAGQLDRLENTYSRQADQLESYQKERKRAEQFLEEVEVQERLVNTVYRDYFATESERFTRVLREIRTLARRAGLDPRSFSYPDTEIGAYEVTRLGIRFSVDGTYDQLRTFVNFLELTDQFLTLESITLTGGKGDRDARLQIRFGVSTIFAQKDADPLEFEPEEDLAADPRPEEDAMDADGSPSVEESGENPDVPEEQEET